MCDGSAAVVLGQRWLVVASDQRNRLAVYDWAQGPTGTAPVAWIDALSGDETADIEGMAVVGDRLWIAASHDAGEGTDRRPERQQLGSFAWALHEGGVDLTDGAFSERLIDDGQWAPQMRGIVGNTVGRGRTDPLGLSLEALGAGPKGAVVLGFRTPVHAGKALVQRLDDPGAFVAGEGPTFVGPRWLDLGGRGIRALSEHAGAWWLIAGPLARGGDGGFVFGRWGAYDQAEAPEVVPIDFGDLQPEALVRWGADWWVLSDDGPDCDGLPLADRRARVARIVGG